MEQGLHKIALRADIDALRMKDSNLTKTENKDEFAHILGHDGHASILIATAELLNNWKERIPKNKSVWLIFQPAETSLSGAKAMIEGGCLEGIEEIYGIWNTHIGWEATISIKHGIMMAGASDIDIEILSDTNDALNAVC